MFFVHQEELDVDHVETPFPAAGASVVKSGERLRAVEGDRAAC